MVEEDAEEQDNVESQGVRAGLLQEEWPADALGLRCSDGMCAWICPQDTQPLYTGTGGWEFNRRQCDWILKSVNIYYHVMEWV